MKGTKKLKGWKRQPQPDPEMCKILRKLVVKVVYAYWNERHKPIPMSPNKACAEYIAQKVQTMLNLLRYRGEWKWGYIGKRTIDRRVNEAADPLFYDDKVPKIVAVSAGLYQPNPELFKNA